MRDLPDRMLPTISASHYRRRESLNICGEVMGLEGVVQARENNSDARRTKATPGGSLGDWRAWAEAILASSDNLSLDRKLRLHVLLPDQDLAVWAAGEDVITLEEVMNRVGTAEEVILHSGAVKHDDRDEVSSERFSHSFEPAPGMICYPSFAPTDTAWTLSDTSFAVHGSEAFPWFIGVDSIGYLARFETALERKWGAFEVEELEDYPVGSVDGTEILRRPSRYFKVSP